MQLNESNFKFHYMFDKVYLDRENSVYKLTISNKRASLVIACKTNHSKKLKVLENSEVVLLRKSISIKQTFDCVTMHFQTNKSKEFISIRSFFYLFCSFNTIV